MPRDEYIRLVVVEAAGVLTFSEACTPVVAAAIPRAVAAVLDELEQLCRGDVSDAGDK